MSGANFLAGILLARYLGVGEFGRFMLVWMIVVLSHSVQHAMVNSPMMSIGPKQAENEVPAYYGAVFAQQLAFSVGSFALLLLVVLAAGAVVPGWEIEGLALPVAVTAVATQLQDFFRRYFFTRDQNTAAFAIDAMSYLGRLAAIVWLFQLTGLDLEGVLWTITATSLIAVASAAFFTQRVSWCGRTMLSVSRRHWRFSKWLTASALLQWASGNFFFIAAGGLLGASVVGGMKAAQNIMGVTHILYQGLENVVPMRAAQRFHQSGLHAMTLFLRRVSIVLLALTGLVALMAASFPEYWLAVVYGDEYRQYAFVLQWFAVIYMLISLTLPLRAALRAVEHTQPIFTAYVIATVAAVVFAIPLLEYLELQGAMLGLFGVQLILQVTLAAGILRYVRGRPR